jgi:hypothetical protein
MSNFSLLVGPEIFFNSAVGLEFLLGYRKSTEKINDLQGYSDKRNGFYFSIGFLVYLEPI